MRVEIRVTQFTPKQYRGKLHRKPSAKVIARVYAEDSPRFIYETAPCFTPELATRAAERFCDSKGYVYE